MGTESEVDHWLVLSELAGWEPRPVEKPSAANSWPGVLEFPRFLRGPRIFLIQPLSLQRESYVPLYARRTRALSVESVVLLQTLASAARFLLLSELRLPARKKSSLLFYTGFSFSSSTCREILSS